MGDVGRCVADALEANELPYDAVEMDHDRFLAASADGYAVAFGDVGDVRLMETLAMAQRSAVVVTVIRYELSKALTPIVRDRYPDLIRFIAVDDDEERARFEALGMRAWSTTAPRAGSIVAAVLRVRGLEEERIGAWMPPARAHRGRGHPPRRRRLAWHRARRRLGLETICNGLPGLRGRRGAGPLTAGRRAGGQGPASNGGTAGPIARCRRARWGRKRWRGANRRSGSGSRARTAVWISATRPSSKASSRSCGGRCRSKSRSSRAADDTRARHQVERVVEVRKLSRDEVLPEIQRLDLLILGGGGILFDGEAQVFLREVMLAHEHRVPVMVYAISAGPLKDAAAQAAVRDGLSRAAVVTVRERGARQALEDAGVHREILVTADPALLLEPQPLPKDALGREGLDTRRQLVGVSVREPGAAAPEIGEQAYHKLLADAADFMVDRYDADVVFVPLEPRMVDVQHAHAVVAQMLRAQRDGAEGRVHLGAAARADGALRVRGRHAPALPDLCELAEPALRGPALRPKVSGFSTTWASRCRRSSK